MDDVLAALATEIERFQHEVRALPVAPRMTNETPLPVACFTHSAIQRGRTTTRKVLRAVYDGQVAWISETRLRGRIPALRACVTSFRTEERDVDALVAGVTSAVE
jgi:hypothetical protein